MHLCSLHVVWGKIQTLGLHMCRTSIYVKMMTSAVPHNLYTDRRTITPLRYISCFWVSDFAVDFAVAKIVCGPRIYLTLFQQPCHFGVKSTMILRSVDSFCGLLCGHHNCWPFHCSFCDAFCGPQICLAI